LALLRGCLYSNGKIKPNRCIVGGKEEEHPEGAYYLYHTKQWIAVGADALEAQRQRNVRLDEEEFKRTAWNGSDAEDDRRNRPRQDSVTVAAERYFSNLEARGVDPKSIRTYRTGVDPFG